MKHKLSRLFWIYVHFKNVNKIGEINIVVEKIQNDARNKDTEAKSFKLKLLSQKL